MICYWTNDWNDQGTAMAEDAAMYSAESADLARCAALYDVANSLSYVEEGEQVVVGPIMESDCWAKVPADWTQEEIEGYAIDKGIYPEDITVRRPGQHPGGSHQAWVSVTAPVFGARVELDD